MNFHVRESGKSFISGLLPLYSLKVNTLVRLGDRIGPCVRDYYLTSRTPCKVLLAVCDVDLKQLVRLNGKFKWNLIFFS
jgi:hypothetical protein